MLLLAGGTPAREMDGNAKFVNIYAKFTLSLTTKNTTISKKRTYQPHEQGTKKVHGFRERMATAHDWKVLAAQKRKAEQLIVGAGATGNLGSAELAQYELAVKTELQVPKTKRFKFKTRFQKATSMVCNPMENVQHLQNMANIASRKAIENSKAIGLPITYEEGGKIIEEAPDGTQKIIGNI
jgi:ribosomal protein L34